MQIQGFQNGDQRIAHGLHGAVNGVFRIEGRRLHAVLGERAGLAVQIGGKLLLHDLSDRAVVGRLGAGQRRHGPGAAALCVLGLQKFVFPEFVHHALQLLQNFLMVLFLLAEPESALHPSVLLLQLIKFNSKHPFVSFHK